jgi:CBS domain-containing protein
MPREDETPTLEVAGARGDLTRPLGELLHRSPLRISADATVAEAARAMRDRATSSALVDSDPPGIVTDRDLRNRVLAEGLSSDTRVAAVMSAPLRSLPAETPVFGALLWLVEERFHHLPVTRNGRVVGVIAERDLLRHQARSPLLLLYRIRELEDTPEALSGYAGAIADVAEALFDGGLAATEIARVIAAVNDHLAARLLHLAEAELGAPPCSYAWLALGSEGRMEQVLLSDQDNALAYAEPSPEAADYFAALARRVVDGLVAAGFPPCPGGFMATNWCMALEEWEARFERWIDVPEPQALLDAEVFLDFRAVHGDLQLAPLERILLSGGGRPRFLHALARGARQFRPPLGPFGRLPRGEAAIDLKVGGIAALVILARLHALAAGTSARPTLARLEAAADGGTLSREGADELAETFRVLTRLRLREQLRSVAAGEPPTNSVLVASLSAPERRRLADALRAVRRVQDATAMRHNVVD